VSLQYRAASVAETILAAPGPFDSFVARSDIVGPANLAATERGLNATWSAYGNYCRFMTTFNITACSGRRRTAGCRLDSAGNPGVVRRHFR
jgi:hypothetical protein